MTTLQAKILKLVKYSLPVLILVTSLLAYTGTSKVSADSLSHTVTETWSSGTCSVLADGSEDAYFGMASGDSLNLTVANSSNQILTLSINNSGAQSQ